GKVHSTFKGTLNGSFSTHLTLITSVGPVFVTLQLDPETDQLTGSLTRNGEVTPIAASRVTPDRDRQVPLAGRYTLLFRNGTSSAAGAGFAAVTVNGLGEAKLTGRAADGTPFTASSSIGPDGRFPFYALLGTRK